jgi:hypothetical protein
MLLPLEYKMMIWKKIWFEKKFDLKKNLIWKKIWFEKKFDL